MRFTKIPLIATLMAVALSLLIVLPTLAQVSGDRTDGRVSVGSWVDVRVAADLDDLDNTRGNDTPASIDNQTGSYASDTAPTFDARDTYFNGDLYISNQEGAFNTILISARVSGDGSVDGKTSNIVSGLSGPDGKFEQDPDTDADETADNIDCTGGAAIATIRNDRSGTRAIAYLRDTGEDDNTVNIYQGIAVIWDQEDAIEKHDGPCGVAMTDPAMFVETDTDVTNNPADGWVPASAAVIPARDGDTLTVSVKGVSGAIKLVVDGDAPEIEDVTPASGVQGSNTVNLGFTASDDGSGLRYDGESGSSTDQDLQPHNGDSDQRFDEPITNIGAGPDNIQGNDDDTGAGNGSTMDIRVLFADDDDGLIMPYLIHADCATGVENDPTDDAECLDTNGDTVKNSDNPAYTGYRINFDPADDVSQYGSNDWTQRTRGVAYDLDMRLVGEEFGTYFWQVTVTDRVGNTAISDGDDEKDGDQPFSFDIDDADPKVVLARTGIGYEDGEGEITGRSWIALSFEHEGKEGEPDKIAADTVQASDFTVDGHTVMNAFVPDDKRVCKVNDPDTSEDESAKNIDSYTARGVKECGFDPGTRVYLELAGELGADETPTIQLLGGVLKDIAGNNNVTQSLENEVEDWIAPGIAITITSSSGTTGRAATDEDGSFTVRVTSDEDLSRFPRLFFATIKGAASIDRKEAGDDDDVIGAASSLKIAAVTGSNGLSLTEQENNVWESEFEDGDIEGSGDRIVAVIITATDVDGNSGNSAGWKGSGTPAVDHTLDFKSLDAGGFLIEFDSTMKKADIEVLPSTDPGTVKDATESINPYIQITFSEPNEYGIAVTDDKGTTEVTDDVADPTADDDNDTATTAAIKDAKPSATDSHAGVEITAFTLNGENMLTELVDVDPWKYVLAVTGLEIGEYEIVYSARDDVGNEVEDEEFTFEVLKRQPYTITLQPGWNLISVPGDPFNPAVGEVIGSDLRTDTVLGYQNGEWVTAVKNEDGRWQGTLVDIQGGYGYWVRTTAVETISTVIPPLLPTNNLPTVPIIAGWNLLGVVDADQTKIGNDGSSEDADEYFTSLNVWRVAYSFQTQLNQWTKLLPGSAAEVENGKGYWVWSTRPGTLVP